MGITLLVMWSTNLPPIQPRFHLLDLFAGQAAVTKVWFLVKIKPIRYIYTNLAPRFFWVKPFVLPQLVDKSPLFPPKFESN